MVLPEWWVTIILHKEVRIHCVTYKPFPNLAYREEPFNKIHDVNDREEPCEVH